ncbi:hypothetical protein C0991_008939 [Blastosporella zonata]|nr:hypothetical protein C0991_008939 [Blastosporella zonata]
MFYKKEVETEIQSEPSKTPQERLRMIEVLKKFEENQQNDVAGTDGDDDGEDLARRFEEVDLAGSLSDEEVDALSHPHSKLVLSLSDLIALFSPTQGAKKTHVTHKLIFYAAYVVSTPAAVLRALAEELEKLSVSYQLRAEGDVATNVNDLERLEDRAVVIEEI